MSFIFLFIKPTGYVMHKEFKNIRLRGREAQESMCVSLFMLVHSLNACSG